MTTITCLVCGAAEEPGQDHTCPVCGADLPPADPEPEPEPETASSATSDLSTDVPTTTESTEEPVAPAAPDTGDVAAPTAPPPPTTEATWPTASAPVPQPPAGGGYASTRPSPYDPSHPSGLSSSVRTYGMLTHLSAFAGALVALAFVGPLVMWLVRRDEHPFIDHHGKEALNFNLSMLLYFVIGIVASVATLGIGLVVVIPAAAIFFLTWVIATIVAAVKANQGEGFRYPLTIRFISDDI